MQPTKKTTITRLPKRADYDETTIYAILDEALFCTISYAVDNQPYSIPTGFCRIKDYIYIHGSVGSGYMRQLSPGLSVCISATLMDALVLTKSIFNHSVNYRSVVAFAKTEVVMDETERWNVLEAFTEKLIPGRWQQARTPNESEMRKTMVLKFKLDEASAKLRQYGPADDEEDFGLPYWSGLIHIKQTRSYEADDMTEKAGIPYPGHFGL